jgi:hypothetical protein
MRLAVVLSVGSLIWIGVVNPDQAAGCYLLSGLIAWLAYLLDISFKSDDWLVL